MRLNRTKGLPISPFSFLHTFRTQLFGRPVRQYTRRTHDATARERTSRVKCPGGLYNELNTCFTYNHAACPWRGICQILPSLAYHTSCIVLLSQQPFFNKQYIALTYYCTYLFFIYKICSVMTFCNRTLWCGQFTRGLQHPITWCEKTEHSHECGTSNL